jgi:hypothetical protein
MSQSCVVVWEDREKIGAVNTVTIIHAGIISLCFLETTK